MPLRLARELPYKEFNLPLRRFHPRYWTMDYNSEMVATMGQIDEHSLVVSAEFRTNRDFIAVRWQSEDLISHLWTKYETDTDYRHTILAFRHNTRRPKESTISIADAQHSWLYRLTPYVLHEDGFYRELLEPGDTGTGRVYPESVLPRTRRYPIPEEEIIPLAGRTDYVFIVDFNDLRQGFGYDRRAIEANGIREIAFNMVHDTYGLGTFAKVVNVVDLGPGQDGQNRIEATLIDTVYGVKLTPGDVVSLSYGVFGNGKQDSVSHDLYVESYSGFGERSYINSGTEEIGNRDKIATLTLRGVGSFFGRFREQGRANAKVVQTMSPTVQDARKLYITDMTVTGNRTTIKRRYYPQPAHDVHMTMGFDDNYNYVPERTVEEAFELGYRGPWNTYVGMSHYFKGRFVWVDKQTGEYIPIVYKDVKLEVPPDPNLPPPPPPAEGEEPPEPVYETVRIISSESELDRDNPDRYYLKGEVWPQGNISRMRANPEDEPVNVPTIRWFEDFFVALRDRGYTHVNSVSYEILNTFCPEDWRQRDFSGGPALSGWNPPSCFVRPSSLEAMEYLAAVEVQFLDAAARTGIFCRFQIGEPWWWDGSYTDGAPCIYDQATLQKFNDETGLFAATPWLESIFETIEPKHYPYLEWLRDQLGLSTDLIRDQTKAEYPNAQAAMLFFTPQILSEGSELTRIVNFPVEQWKSPNYDFVQIEDYDWIIHGELYKVPQTFEAATSVLGYPKDVVEYFSGFVLFGSDYHIWTWVSTALDMAREAGIPEVYIWAYTQIMREGIVVVDEE